MGFLKYALPVVAVLLLLVVYTEVDRAVEVERSEHSYVTLEHLGKMVESGELPPDVRGGEVHGVVEARRRLPVRPSRENVVGRVVRV